MKAWHYVKDASKAHFEAATDSESFLNDVGFLYGVGAFETILVQGTELVLLSYHRARLKHALEDMGIPTGFLEDCFDAIHTVLRSEAHQGKSVMNVYVSGGEREAYLLGQPISPKCWIVLRPYKRPKPLHVVPCLTDHGVASHSYKSLNYVSIAKYMRQVKQGVQHRADSDVEGMVYTEVGQVLEGLTTSVFFVKGRTVFSPQPSVSDRVVDGTFSAFLKERVHECGFTFEERPIALSEIQEFDDLFFGNSVYHVREVIHVEGYPGCVSGAQTQQIKTWVESVLGV